MTQLEHQVIAIILSVATYFMFIKNIFNTEKRKIAWTAYFHDKVWK